MIDKIDEALDAFMSDDPRGAWDNKSRVDMIRAIAATGLAAENERLRELLRKVRPLVASSRSWKSAPIVEQIDAALGKDRP